MDEKLIIAENGNYILARNVAEIRHAKGGNEHYVEIRVVGDSSFIPVKGKMSDYITKSDGTYNLMEYTI